MNLQEAQEHHKKSQTKMWEKRLERLDWWIKQDDRIHEANKEWFKVVFPDSYPLVFAHSLADGYIDGLSYNNKALKDWLDYIAYEVPTIKDKCTVIDEQKREYDFSKRSEQIRFFINNF